MLKVSDVHAQWRALPTGTLEEVAGSGTCLVLAPHPDDESLGCGGLIAACCAAGRPPVVAVLTDGSGSHPGSRAFPPTRLAAIRKAEVTAAVGPPRYAGRAPGVSRGEGYQGATKWGRFRSGHPSPRGLARGIRLQHDFRALAPRSARGP